MKIGYFGDGPWAQKAFEKINRDETLQIVFVAVRYAVPDIVLKRRAEERGIPVYIYKNINSAEFREMIVGHKADLFVSMSYDQIFKEALINMPPCKTINCHAGKLPFYRGRNILNWTLINDESEFGITVHYVDEGIDTGDIILQRLFPITDEDDYGTLLKRAYDGCSETLYDAIKMIQNGTATVMPQEDIDPVGFYCGRRGSGDEMIDWNQSSRQIFNFVRAVAIPGPVATTYIAGQEVKIYKTEMIPGAHSYVNTPGQIVGKEGNALIVKTADTTLKIVDYKSNVNIKVGDRLGAKYDG